MCVGPALVLSMEAHFKGFVRHNPACLTVYRAVMCRVHMLGAWPTIWGQHSFGQRTVCTYDHALECLLLDA
jgi:hypothetical protein